MSIFQTIRAGLDDYLINTVDIPPIAHQNVITFPTTGITFVKPTLVPVSVRPATRGINPQLRYDGLYNILICTPEGEGSGEAYDTADLLLNRFKATTDISYGGIIISINYSEVGVSYLDPPFYCTPVTVAWYLYNS